MIRDDREARAAEYALGTLDAVERAQVDTALARDAELRRLVEHWEQQLAPLALDLPAEPLPDGLFERIEAALSDDDVLPGTRTVRAEAGTWRTLGRGVSIKLLHRDRASGRRTALLRMEAGSTFESHEHAQDEECLVLEGEVHFGPLLLRAGDYHLAPAGVPHPAATTATGCLMLVTGVL